MPNNIQDEESLFRNKLPNIKICEVQDKPSHFTKHLRLSPASQLPPHTLSNMLEFIAIHCK